MADETGCADTLATGILRFVDKYEAAPVRMLVPFVVQGLFYGPVAHGGPLVVLRWFLQFARLS
jgi:hypothetical protein